MLKYITPALLLLSNANAQIQENLYWSNQPFKSKLENEIAESYSRIAFALDDQEYYYWQGRNKAYRECYDWISYLELHGNLD